MKKVISLMLALVLALSLTACGGKSSGPEGVVGRFCKGLQELDEEAIAQCFENGDDLELSDLEDVDSDDAVAQKIMDFMKSCAGRLKHQVGGGHRGRRYRHGAGRVYLCQRRGLMKDILTEYIPRRGLWL
ncbi:MAG: hypothetical protein ACLU38_00190 [Dysosmobacter sp.]